MFHFEKFVKTFFLGLVISSAGGCPSQAQRLAG